MIIDVHAHLWDRDVPSETFWESYIKVMSLLSNQPLDKVRGWLPPQWDLSGDLLVKDMDEAGIDKTVVSAIDYGLTSGVGESKYSVEEINKFYAEAARRHPSRIIAFAGIDPRRAEAVQLLETAVKEWGMRGLKLMPACGWFPHDKAFYPLYGKAEELGIPLLFHTGPEVYPARSMYCRPVYLDEVACDFPDLKIIAAHSGYCWWEEAAWVSSYKPNLYLDIATWQSKIARRPLEEFYKPLRAILNITGASKVLFGSDWPGFRAMRRLNNVAWVKAFKEPPESVKAAGIEFTEVEINGILGNNAVNLLGLQTQ